MLISLQKDLMYSYKEEVDEEIDELCMGCTGMRKMSFAGKHIRLCTTMKMKILFPWVLRLKGFHTPKEKQVRFIGDE